MVESFNGAFVADLAEFGEGGALGWKLGSSGARRWMGELIYSRVCGASTDPVWGSRGSGRGEAAVSGPGPSALPFFPPRSPSPGSQDKATLDLRIILDSPGAHNPKMHPPSFTIFLHHHRRASALDSSDDNDMPPPYQPNVFPARCAPRKGAPPPPIATPPPYRTSQQAPGSPDSLDDPHYLTTPTQRDYFVNLSNMFEEQAMSKMIIGGASPELPTLAARKQGGFAAEWQPTSRAEADRALLPAVPKPSRDACCVIC